MRNVKLFCEIIKNKSDLSKIQLTIWEKKVINKEIIADDRRKMKMAAVNSRVNLSDTVLEKLEEMVSKKKPGDRLPTEAELSEQF